MSIKKKIILVLVVIFVVLQLYPVQQPEILIDNPNDFIAATSPPKPIVIKLRAACYDCHSFESELPWYAYIAPSKWLVYKHINKGRNELNFSNWNLLNNDDKAEILDDISTVLYEDEMPLKNYTLVHSNAKLTEEDKETIINWTEELLESLYE